MATRPSGFREMQPLGLARVYLAELARYAWVSINHETRSYLNQLKRTDGVYYATTRADLLALRPHEVV
jgi:hypothetical protein